MIPLINDQKESYEETFATFAKKRLNINRLMIKIIAKFKTIVVILVNTEVLHIA